MLRTLIQNENFVLEISICKATSQKPVNCLHATLCQRGVRTGVALFSIVGLQVQA